ncbi:MAG: adenosine deaminase [Treponema sp.]|nr:adenosine deaminase [Treponema sp.]
MKKEAFYSFLRSIPKAEIHIHIEAIISLESVKKLYLKRFGTPITEQEQHDLFSYSDLNGFIQAFLKVQDLFQSPDDFNLVFEDFKNYLIENNIVYCEAFIAPTAFLKKGFDYAEMVAVISRNIEKIKKETGRTIKMLVDVSRTFGCDNAMNNYKLFKANINEHFIGIGLGGAEQKGPAKDFAPVYDQAIKDGVHVVAHAGEDVGPESMWDAINYLHVERIGHGITSIQDPKLIAYLAEKQLPLEVCPTSNTFTKKIVTEMKKHPIRQLFDAGVHVTVNTDDPVFFKVSLTDELWNLHTELHFSMEEINTLIQNAFKAAFIPKTQKEEYLQAEDAAWNGELNKQLMP